MNTTAIQLIREFELNQDRSTNTMTIRLSLSEMEYLRKSGYVVFHLGGMIFKVYKKTDEEN